MALDPARPRPRCLAAGLFVAAALAVAAGCTSEDATPLEPGLATTAPGTPHGIDPTEEMRELARRQCLDDPELAEGEINAVDPADPEQVLASVVVDCDDVR
jgi:hypothetical protein